MWGERTRTIALWLLALLIATSMGVLLAANPAHAATFVVNRTADTPDANLANAACDANASQAGNQCTLRAAIQESNDTNGVDQIRFNIVSAASVKTISPASALPTITEALTINGYSQTGASANTLAEGNDAVLKIQLNGTNAGSANGLVIQASDSTVKGLVINRFEGNGVLISGSGATGTKVQGNFLGTNAAGSADRGNGDGVAISSASDSTIGSAIGSTAGGNRIANNDQDGVLVFGGAAVGNRVLSNSIFSNGETGIDLGGGTEDSFEVTANDTDDPDAPTSNNHRQNFPVITSATRSATTNFTTITGTLNSNPNQTYTVQCFVAAPDPSGHGEGQIPVAQTTVQTDAGGDDSFTCVSPVPQAGQLVSATATNTSGTASGTSIGDTSEFSQNVGVTLVP